MSEKPFTFTILKPIKVQVKLKSSQYLGLANIGQWQITVEGQVRHVPHQVVEWHCLTLAEAAKSFLESESEEFTITGNINY